MDHFKRTAYMSALLILTFLTPVINASSISLTAQAPSRNSDLVYPRAGFNFSKKDDERIALFRAQFMIRLHGILISNYYEVLQNAVTDWGTAIQVYETMAQDSETLLLASSTARPELAAGHVFEAFQEYFKRKATLCSEASRANLSPYMAKGLFSTLVKQASGFYFPRTDLQTFNLWSKKGTDVELTFRKKLQDAKNEWSTIDQSDLISVHENIEGEIPFDMPFTEFHDERNYIYATLLEGSDVPRALQLYYHVNFLNLAAKSATAVGYPLAEIGLFEGGLANTFFAKRIGFASALLDVLLDCGDETLKNVREGDYAEVVEFHEAVRQRLLEPNQRLEELLKSKTLEPLRATPMTGVYSASLSNLLSKTRQYIDQRTKIAEYALKLKTFAAYALQRFRQEGRQSLAAIDDEHKKYLNALMTKDPDRLRDPELPCAAAKRMIELSSQPETGKSNDTGLDKDAAQDEVSRGEGAKPDEEYEFNIATVFRSRLTINPGDMVSITAEGVISVGFFAGNSSPDGIDGFTEYSFVPQFKHGSLLVRIGANQNGWRFCGSRCSTQTPITGDLEFLVNDRDFSNNDGSYRVRITIKRARSRRK